MRVIANTNIIVDDFGYCKSFPKNTFVHFLTHFHADHWDGMTPKWDYGPIYCSQVTADLIINKFPKLDHLIVRCQYYKEYCLEVGNGNLVVKFWLFDAKHIPGSAMILFEGYMGRIMFTGDFRYEFSMVLENPILFPPQMRQRALIESKISLKDDRKWVEAQTGISIQIDELIFDNTYCNQMFDFQTGDKIFHNIVKIIDQHRGKKVLITLGALGKNKILFQLSEYYQTLIHLDQDKLSQVQASGGHTHIFTTNPEEAFIHVVKKSHRKSRIEQQKLKGNKFICINTDFLMIEHHSPDGINFIVPYSVHSNWKEMQTLVRMICPAMLFKLVIPFQSFKEIRYNKIVDNRLRLAKYLNRLQNIQKSKSGYSELIRKYSDIRKLSKEYLQWMYPQSQEQLMKVLKIGKPDHSLRKRQLVFQQRQDKKEKKRSLSDIAGQLKATHMNRSLKEMILSQQSQNREQQYNKIYRMFYQS